MAGVLCEPYFTDEQAAFDRLEAIVWPNGVVCPHCRTVGRARPLEGVKGKTGKPAFGRKKCYACRKQFTVRVGTVFERSHVPLHMWFQAAYLMCSSKKGISSNQLHRTLGVTLKTAWLMSHRLREAMRLLQMEPASKEAIVSSVEREGGGRSLHVAKMKPASSRAEKTSKVRRSRHPRKAAFR